MKQQNKDMNNKKTPNKISGGEDDHENHPCAMEGEYFEDGKVSLVRNNIKKTPEIDNCWNRFARLVRCFWATKQTENCEEDKSLYINTTVRELLVYIIFLVLLMIITFCMRPGHMFYFTNALNNLLLNTQFNDQSGSFSNMQSISDFWKFVTGPLINALYWNTWYNSQPMGNSEKNFIYFENKLVGLPRMRQLRVRKNSCIVPTIFQNTSQCYATYSKSTESKETYGLQNSTAWSYSEESVLQEGSFLGTFTTYGGGGYYVDLPSTSTDALQIILNLFNNQWIDRNTRFMMIDFTVYNANINLFCIIRLVFEFPPVGGTVVNNEFRTLKLIRYVNPLDFFVLACEILFFIFLVYYIIEEIIEIKKHKFDYFFSLWNFLDVIVLLLCTLCVGFHVYRFITVETTMNMLLKSENEHPNFEGLSFWQLQYDNLSAFVVFVASIKIFKYISFNKMMTQLISTLNLCLKDLVGFSLMFFIIFLAFAQAGYLIFGTQMADYREFYTCIFTLFRIILNDCNFKAFLPINPILGPIYFILYVIFVFFILFNMFLAILDDAYGEIKEEMEDQENEFEISDFLKEKSKMVLEKLHLKKEKIIDLENAMKTADANNDGVMDFDEWKAELKRRGYEEKEIESLFKRYDTDGDRVLDEQEQLDMLRELNAQKSALDTELVEEKLIYDTINQIDGKIQPISLEKYMSLFRRIDNLDNVIVTLMQKFDNILNKFQSIIKTKDKSRISTEVILNALTMMANDSEEERKDVIESIVQEELYKLNQDSHSNLELSQINNNNYSKFSK